MRTLTAILIALGLAMVAKSQNVDFYGNALAKDLCNQFGMKDDEEAQNAMNKICDAADIPDNFVLAPCPNIGNCFALNKDGVLYIVYDINFFNKIKTFGFTDKNLPGKKIDWVALTILAHELGHHMCQHTTNKLITSRYTPVELELQADEYAGTIMYKLHATLEEAQRAFNSDDVPEEATFTHPGRKARLEAIAKGWNKEYNKYAAMKGLLQNSVPTNQTSPITQVSNPAVSVPDNNTDPALTVLPGMVQVDGGTFSMGSNNGNADEKPVHAVTVGSFLMGINEVTVKEYKQFCLVTKRALPEAPSWRWNDGDPIVNVSYEDALAYCAWLGKAYKKNCRLPTEAEWEYAARGGNKSNGYAYSGSSNIDDVGWYDGNAGLQANPVGKKKPNELGLYDMTGNVYEWCADWYDANYYGSSQAQNPAGPETGTQRVVRGGSWSLEPQFCRATARSANGPGLPYSSIGFRVVISDVQLKPSTTASTPTFVPAVSQVKNNTPASPSVSQPPSTQVAVGSSTQSTAANIPPPPVPPKRDNKQKTQPVPPSPTDIPGMVLVQGGVFKMGTADGASDQKPVHQVTVGTFYISMFEVTQAEWQSVMGSNPSANHCDSCPVENVTWDEANDFCRKKSAATGKTYRLPTEAEWEYAARGGNKSKGFLYSGGNDLDPVGWFTENSNGTTQPVGKKKPNELGIYDMTGNVWEWCSDLYGNYQATPAQNPQGAESGSFHVFRGGSWNNEDDGSTVFSRGASGHSDHLNRVGFRVVLAP